MSRVFFPFFFFLPPISAADVKDLGIEQPPPPPPPKQPSVLPHDPAIMSVGQNPPLVQQQVSSFFFLSPLVSRTRTTALFQMMKYFSDVKSIVSTIHTFRERIQAMWMLSVAFLLIRKRAWCGVWW